MLSRTEWQRFEETAAWREIVGTVKVRMQLVMQDILDENICKNAETLAKFQAEYKTCLWFINLPKLDEQGKGKDDEEMDSSGTAPLSAAD